jgi:tetratricopeptide (TPR) repeat protein
MFFPRLRRQARWAFALMVLVFALGFAFLGVGTGSGVGDLLQGGFGRIFGGGGSSSPSIGKAQDRIKKNPKDAQAYRDLAAAYQAKRRTPEAIGALKKYTALRPKDKTATEELAALQLSRAESLRSIAASAYAEQQQTGLGQAFGPSPSSKLGQALGTDPITQAVSSHASTTFSNTYAKMQGAYRDAVTTYSRLGVLEPDEPNIQEELAIAAETGGETKIAVAAYRRYLKLNPDATDAASVKQRIKQLQAQSVLSTASTGK